MRKDMALLLQETHHGSRKEVRDGTKKFLNVRDLDDLPSHISNKYIRGWDGGGSIYNTRYNPLKRFLESNLGRPWDKVFHEICLVADDRSIEGNQLRETISHQVRMTPPGNERISGYRWWGSFYVDAKGFLRKEPSHKSYRRRMKEKEATAPIERVPSTSEDAWFELVEIPDGPRESQHTKFHKVWFQINRIWIDQSRPEYEYVKDGNGGWINTGKVLSVKRWKEETYERRQCNHKQIKQIEEWIAKRRKVLTRKG